MSLKQDGTSSSEQDKETTKESLVERAWEIRKKYKIITRENWEGNKQISFKGAPGRLK